MFLFRITTASPYTKVVRSADTSTQRSQTKDPGSSRTSRPELCSNKPRSVEQNDFDLYANSAVNERVFKPFWKVEPDDEAFNRYITDLEGKLDAYDKILEKQKYIAGDEITLADFFHLPYGFMLSAARSEVMNDEKRPNVVRWWKDISNLPSWLAVREGKFESIPA